MGCARGRKSGLQVSSDAPWLANVSASNVLIALRSKLGDLVDEILLAGEAPPTIYMVMWLSDLHPEDQDEDDG